jgi:hypothetical protein
MLLLLFTPTKWNINRVPIETPQTCLDRLTVELGECATLHPDSTSLARQTCEANARGRYTACIGW